MLPGAGKFSWLDPRAHLLPNPSPWPHSLQSLTPSHSLSIPFHSSLPDLWVSISNDCPEQTSDAQGYDNRQVPGWRNGGSPGLQLLAGWQLSPSKHGKAGRCVWGDVGCQGRIRVQSGPNFRFLKRSHSLWGLMGRFSTFKSRHAAESN